MFELSWRALLSAGALTVFGCSSSGGDTTGGGSGGNDAAGMNAGGNSAGGGNAGGRSSGGTNGGGVAGTAGASGGAAGGLSSSGGRGPDLCQSAASCPGGACWQRLDGVKDCVNPTPTPTLQSCEFAQSPCCSKDGDCTGGPAPRCLPTFDVAENFCGGAAPQGNACRYDRCKSDGDCTEKPASATAAVCLPSGALGTYFAQCAYGGCRTNADCTQHPGGVCSYGLGPTNGMCSLVNVLYCAYPSDACGNAGQSCPPGKVCAPNADYQGRSCGQGPPMYP